MITYERKSHLFIIAALLIVYAFLLLRTAWVCDDAYITLRTVDNFINGYGLTWNVAERVQAYTHPLWMFLLSIFYLFSHEAFITTIVVSSMVSMAAVLMFVFKIAPSAKTAILGMLIFILSKFFIDYSTSGLENPLTHLLLAFFFLNYFSTKLSSNRLRTLAFIASLLMLTRLDLILLVLPPLLYHMRHTPIRKSLRYLFVGFLPLIVWEIFSFWYYGSLIPNTGYAKLNTGIGSWDLFVQGSHYLEAALRGDRLMILVILTAVGLTIWRKGRAGWPVATGIVLYMTYVTYAGGCFMGGRFFTGPLFAAVILLTRYRSMITSRKATIAAFCVIILVGLLTTRSHISAGTTYGLDDNRGLGYGIDDNRLLHFQKSGLWTAEGFQTEPHHPWVDKGLRFKNENPGPVHEGGIGYTGYYGGPDVHIVDVHALSEPFLARLPAVFDVLWRIGHFRRAIPEGYLESHPLGENKIADPDLAQFYDSLRYVISGPLWNWKRVKTAINLNLGSYNHLLDDSGVQLLSMHARELTEPVPDGTPWTDKAVYAFPTKGILIYLDTIWKNDAIEISLDGNDTYTIVFGMGQDIIAETTVTPTDNPAGGSVAYTIAVPDKAVANGYDRIIVRPKEGDGIYAIGHLLAVNKPHEITRP